MKLLGAFFILAASLIVVTGAEATVCRARVVQHAAAVVDVQPVLLATVVPIAAYSVQYAPGGADVQQLLAEIKALRAEVQAIKAGPAVEQKKEAAPAPLKHLEILQAKCQSCHDANVSKAKGGGFTMFEAGKLALLTDRQLRKVSTRTYAGDMPPKGQPQLSDAEVGEVMRWLNSLE